MIWVVGWLGAMLATGVSVVLVVGGRLPETHRATCRLRLTQPEGAVWDALREVALVKARPDIQLQVVDEQPGQRLVVRIANDDLPFGGTWTWSLARAGDGTVVTVTEDGLVKNALFRFVSAYVMGHHATMETSLKALAKRLGAPATIEHLD